MSRCNELISQFVVVTFAPDITEIRLQSLWEDAQRNAVREFLRKLSLRAKRGTKAMIKITFYADIFNHFIGKIVRNPQRDRVRSRGWDVYNFPAKGRHGTRALLKMLGTPVMPERVVKKTGARITLHNVEQLAFGRTSHVLRVRGYYVTRTEPVRQ